GGAGVAGGGGVAERSLAPDPPPPLQPAKVERRAGEAVSLTAVPLSNVAEHVEPQLIPAGFEVTVPRPVPVLLTESVNLCRANVAVTVVSAFKVTVQVPVPEQPPPLQPVKFEPVAGAAVGVTVVPLSKDAEQLGPQSRPG